MRDVSSIKNQTPPAHRGGCLCGMPVFFLSVPEQLAPLDAAEALVGGGRVLRRLEDGVAGEGHYAVGRDQRVVIAGVVEDDVGLLGVGLVLRFPSPP